MTFWNTDSQIVYAKSECCNVFFLISVLLEVSSWWKINVNVWQWSHCPPFYRICFLVQIKLDGFVFKSPCFQIQLVIGILPTKINLVLLEQTENRQNNVMIDIKFSWRPLCMCLLIPETPWSGLLANSWSQLIKADWIVWSRVFNYYSSIPNGLWVNSSWRRRSNGLLTQRPWGWEKWLF